MEDKIGFAGNPPTGKPYVASAIDIYRFKNSKVVERWGNSDVMGIAQQLGYVVVPKP
jgi:predicted ester cyclase